MSATEKVKDSIEKCLEGDLTEEQILDLLGILRKADHDLKMALAHNTDDLGILYGLVFQKHYGCKKLVEAAEARINDLTSKK
jgi:hypothetical protein